MLDVAMVLIRWLSLFGAQMHTIPFFFLFNLLFREHFGTNIDGKYTSWLLAINCVRFMAWCVLMRYLFKNEERKWLSIFPCLWSKWINQYVSDSKSGWNVARQCTHFYDLRFGYKNQIDKVVVNSLGSHHIYLCIFYILSVSSKYSSS